MAIVGVIIAIALIVWFAKQDRQTHREIERDREREQQQRLQEAKREAVREHEEKTAERAAAQFWDDSLRDSYAYRMRLVVDSSWAAEVKADLDRLDAAAKRLREDYQRRYREQLEAAHAVAREARADRPKPASESGEWRQDEEDSERVEQIMAGFKRAEHPQVYEAFDASDRRRRHHQADARAWFDRLTAEAREAHRKALIEDYKATSAAFSQHERGTLLTSLPSLSAGVVQDDALRSRHAQRPAAALDAARIAALVEAASSTLAQAELEILGRSLDGSPWLDTPHGTEALGWLRFELLSTVDDRNKPRGDLGGRSFLDVLTTTGGEAILVGRWIERLERHYRDFPNRRSSLGSSFD